MPLQDLYGESCGGIGDIEELEAVLTAGFDTGGLTGLCAGLAAELVRLCELESTVSVCAPCRVAIAIYCRQIYCAWPAVNLRLTM